MASSFNFTDKENRINSKKSNANNTINNENAGTYEKRNEWDIEDAGQTPKIEKLRSVEHVLHSHALILFSLSIHFRSQLCGIRRRAITKKSRMRGLDQV
jgi:hypothetical protein